MFRAGAWRDPRGDNQRNCEDRPQPSKSWRLASLRRSPPDSTAMRSASRRSGASQRKTWSRPRRAIRRKRNRRVRKTACAAVIELAPRDLEQRESRRRRRRPLRVAARRRPAPGARRRRAPCPRWSGRARRNRRHEGDKPRHRRMLRRSQTHARDVVRALRRTECWTRPSRTPPPGCSRTSSSSLAVRQNGQA